MGDIILVILGIIILFSYFRRAIFFFIINAISKRAFNHMQDRQGTAANRSSKPEASITIDPTVSGKSKRNNDDSGDYVDYEEIK